MQHPFYYTWDTQKNAYRFDLERARGAYLYYRDNPPVFDLTSISLQASFGHNHPVIIDAIKAQMERFSLASPKADHPLKYACSEALLTLLNLPEGKIFYTVSGAESVENAAKIARQITGKRKILARQNSYHGASLGALSLTGDWRNQAHATVSDWTVRIPEPFADPDASQTRKIILEHGKDSFAAFCLETVTAVNGVIVPPETWWQGIQALCQEFGILLILDEVACGFFRTGKAFALHHWNLKPDLVCMAKAISGGHFPFGAVWTSSQIAHHYDNEKFSCGLTSYAHPLGLAALDGVLNILAESGFKEKLMTLEKTFRGELDKISKLGVVSEIRQIGLMAAIDLKKEANWKHFFKHKLYLITSNGNKRVILAPPFVATPQELTPAMHQLQTALKEL